MYVQAACAGRAAAAVAGEAGAADANAGRPDVVMAGVDIAAAHPGLVAAFDHVVFVDPPFSAALHDEIVAAASPSAWVHSVWGPADVHFTEKVLQSGYDLDAAARRAWRVLEAGDGRFDESLEQELVAQGAFVAPVATVAAALRVLCAAGLLRWSGADYELKRPQDKADITTTEAYRAWRRRFHTRAYLASCLTQRR
jgi:hypothetical protein